MVFCLNIEYADVTANDKLLVAEWILPLTLFMACARLSDAIWILSLTTKPTVFTAEVRLSEAYWRLSATTADTDPATPVKI